jgi:hypothetical protein
MNVSAQGDTVAVIDNPGYAARLSRSGRCNDQRQKPNEFRRIAGESEGHYVFIRGNTNNDEIFSGRVPKYHAATFPYEHFCDQRHA